MDVVRHINSAVRSALSLAADERFIVGLSGGADSVALLSAMRAAGFHCVAAHCNFGLRGEESERDARFAASVASRLGVEIEMTRVDVPAWRATHGGSVEMACRELRYAWFARLIEKHRAKAVAVAHHRDDNQETFMLNLMRGTGIDGLCGMGTEVMQPVAVVRPLLGVARRDILDYLDAVGLSYVTDSSNLTNDYTRNRIRNVVMPALREQFPHAHRGISLTMTHLQEANDFIREALASYRTKYVGANGEIFIRRLVDESGSAPFVLYELLSPLGFSRQQTDDAVSAVSNSQSGRLFEVAGEMWLLDRDVLRRYDDQQPRNDTGSSDGRLGPFSVEIVEGEEIVPSALVAYFSPEVLHGQPLRWRYWRQADRLRPFGMKGSRKLSDIFSDAKIAVDMKGRIPLLVKGDDILWVAGLRHSRLYPVEEPGGKMVKITFNDEIIKQEI